MKVKKLEWEKTSFYEHTAVLPEINLKFKIYYNTQLNEYIPRILTVGHMSELSLIAPVRNLDQAKEACQKHFEKFILDQIEPEENQNKSNVFDPTLIGFESIKESKLNYKFKKDNRYVLWQSKSLGDTVWNFIFDPRIKVDSEGQFIEFDALKNPNNIFEFFRHREFLDHEAGAEIVTKFLKERGLYA